MDTKYEPPLLGNNEKIEEQGSYLVDQLNETALSNIGEDNGKRTVSINYRTEAEKQKASRSKTRIL